VAHYLYDFGVFCASVLATTDNTNPVCEVIKRLKTSTWSDNPKEEQVKTRADIARLEGQIAELRAASIRSHENKDILDNAAPPPASG
jgi:hypothetical protein